MPQPDLSQAQRLLLDKYVRGEIPASGSTQGHQQPAAARPTGLTHQPLLQPAVKNASGRSFISRALNRILHLICRFGPGGTTLRPFLHRMRGVIIGQNVWIGDDVYLDNEFPNNIEIQDGAMIELRTTVIAHTHGEGRVVIGKNAFLGAGCMVVAPANRTVVIGESAVIVASSLVNTSVAPYTLYGSDSAKPLAKITKPFTADTSYDDFIADLRPLSY